MPEALEPFVPVPEQQIEVIVQNDVVISEVIERPCQVEHLAAPVLSLPESSSAVDIGVPVWFASLAVISRLLPLFSSCSSFLPSCFQSAKESSLCNSSDWSSYLYGSYCFTTPLSDWNRWPCDLLHICECVYCHALTFQWLSVDSTGLHSKFSYWRHLQSCF